MDYISSIFVIEFARSYFASGCLRKGGNAENQGLAMQGQGQGKGGGKGKGKNVFPILQVGADPFGTFPRLPFICDMM